CQMSSSRFSSPHLSSPLGTSPVPHSEPCADRGRAHFRPTPFGHGGLVCTQAAREDQDEAATDSSSPLAPWGGGVGVRGCSSPLAPWGRGVGVRGDRRGFRSWPVFARLLSSAVEAMPKAPLAFLGNEVQSHADLDASLGSGAGARDYRL